ncbi:MAG: hypothetical protein ACK4ZX_05545, partial [Thermus sp.]
MLKKLWNAVEMAALLGPGILLLAIQYARRRDRWEPKAPLPPWQGVGKPLGLTAIPGGVRVRFQGAELEAVFLGEDHLRLTWFPNEAVPSYALTEAGETSSFELEDQEGGYLLKTPRLALAVGEEGLTLWDGAGRLLWQETYPERSGRAWRHRVRLLPEERVLGLGERAYPLDRRGGVFRFWNQDPGGSYGPGEDPLYLSVPLWLSLKPAGECLAFYENSADGFADLRGGEALVGFLGGTFHYHLIPGPLEEALARYVRLTGLPPLPPRWALGFHYARWGLRTRKEVEEVIALAKKHNFGTIAMKTLGGVGRATRDPNFMAKVPPGTSPAAAVIRWVASNPNLTALVVELKNVQQLEEDLGALRTAFSPQDEQMLRLLAAYNQGAVCLLCHECVSRCPEHISIAEILRYERYAQ